MEVIDRVRDREDLFETELDSEGNQTADDSPAEINDKWRSKAEDWLRHLAFRQTAFGHYYPFVLTADERVLRLRDGLSSQHRLYLFLLLASNLRYVMKTAEAALTKDFEILSREVLKNCLPSCAEVYIFGSGNNQTDARYSGNVWSKIDKLAGDLHERNMLGMEDLSVSSTGDEGLDLVGWVPTGDQAGGQIIVFAQCACTTQKWKEKQHSSSPSAWNNKIHFTAPPTNVTFVPMCFRKTDGSWHKPGDVCYILIDRLRFVALIRDRHEIIENQPSYGIIEGALQLSESLF